MYYKPYDSMPKKCELSWIPLAPDLSTKNALRDEFWMVIANTTIEADE